MGGPVCSLNDGSAGCILRLVFVQTERLLMKQSTLRLPLLVALLGLGTAAHAQDGTVTFNGQVTSLTCEISFNGKVGNNPIITLPAVSATSLPIGSSAGRTPVRVHADGADPICSSGALTLVLNAADTANLRNGRMSNVGAGIGGGTNAMVGLLNGMNTRIDLTGGAEIAGSPAPGGGSDFTLYAEYYADGADAMPGSFEAPLQYTLIYP